MIDNYRALTISQKEQVQKIINECLILDKKILMTKYFNETQRLYILVYDVLFEVYRIDEKGIIESKMNIGITDLLTCN